MSVKKAYQDLIRTVGEGASHYLFPNDFEYYAMSLELVSVDKLSEETVDYFVLPVLPSSYNNNERTQTNIRQTNKGNIAIRNSKFIPRQIRINGDFGRSFKFLLGANEVSTRALRWSTTTGNYSGEDDSFRTQFFSPSIKTGYGALKVLEAIVNKSKKLDSKGVPYVLYFYNPAMGENYIVEPDTLIIEQNSGKSRIYSYTLTLNAVGLLQPNVPVIGRGPLSREIVTNGVSLTAKALKSFIS